MKNLITGLLLIAASAFLALAIREDNGYVLFGYGSWTVEGSLAFFALINLLLFALLYLVVRLVVRVWAMPNSLHQWRDRRSASRARKSLTRGLVALSEGNWKNAEKSLVRFAGKSETPLLNYLAAARSAQQQGAHDRRDHYLQLAHESMPSADVAVGLTQAELQIAHEQLEQALATLKHLRSIAPRHAHVLKLLMELHQRLGDWQELQLLLPELKKRKVVGSDELKALELNIYRNLLNRAAQSEEPGQLGRTWKGIPLNHRYSEAMVCVYVNHLMNRGQQDLVEDLLREAIERHWSDDMVEFYGRVESSDSARQLSNAEAWLERHPRNASLLLTLGRLCLRSKLWGKARSYLEASIGVNPTSAAYCELGVLLESMGEKEKAREYYRAGLELTSAAPMIKLPEVLESQPAPKLEAPGPAKPPKLEVVKST